MKALTILAAVIITSLIIFAASVSTPHNKPFVHGKLSGSGVYQYSFSNGDTTFQIYQVGSKYETLKVY
jgi:hypothetical protein